MDRVEENHGMEFMRQEKKTFKNHTVARYVTDVTFQHRFRPGGAMEKGNKYYSGKHKVYGYKVEMSVLPVALEILISEHYLGSKSDIEMFRSMRQFHEKETLKIDFDLVVEEFGELHSEHPSRWGILVDKGYQGAQELIREIHPNKNHIQGILSASDGQFIRKVFEDRIIVESFFGRLTSLWNVMSSKLKWAEKATIR